MMADMVSLAKRYSAPVALLILAIFWQLLILPSSFPPSHYDAIGVKRFSSIEEVSEAYGRLLSEWNSGKVVPKIDDFIKARYAFELLTNPVWKRNYDTFDIEEQLHVVNNAKKYGDSFSSVDLPLLESSSFDPTDDTSTILTAENFKSMLGQSAHLLDGVAETGVVELGEVELAKYLAEKSKTTGKPFFRRGLPSLIAFPHGCRSSECLIRYQGDLSVDAVVDWMTTIVLGLPRILYYSKESLVQDFIMKAGSHKAKVIGFSKTGERAAPFLRQAAKDYWAYASFGFVLWREELSSIWWNMFEVESAPALVFLKDPGVKPVVYHGALNSSSFLSIIEQNKHQVLPQLRSVTSKELGCDARGYSRAGNHTTTWYCVILAGRLSPELNQMRETMRRVQDILSDEIATDISDKDDFPVPQLAVQALQDKRLTFAWLDGEAQKKYCFFYLYSEYGYETCGPRRYDDPVDVPQLFIVRYSQNSSKVAVKVERPAKTIWDTLREEEEDHLASQLVARYNGSSVIPSILEWISQIIKDGDSKNLPFFRMKTPELIPEDANPLWSKGAEGIVSTSKSIKLKLQSIGTDIYDRMRDPRVGPILLLVASLYFGTIWLHASESIQQGKKDISGDSTKDHTRARVNSERPASITDIEPKDAHQMVTTDSDSN
ncbi:hypothetical protein AMTRI_Chr04g190660 [Amborella trichopoda]